MEILSLSEVPNKMTTIEVRRLDRPSKTLTFDKPFAEITASEIMEVLNCCIYGWTEIKDK